MNIDIIFILIFINKYQSFVQENAEADRDTKDESATNFLRFLMEGRWYVLEDLAIEDNTDAKFYKQHPVFKHPRWPEYRARVRTLHNTPPCQLHQVGCFVEENSLEGMTL